MNHRLATYTVGRILHNHIAGLEFDELVQEQVGSGRVDAQCGSVLDWDVVGNAVKAALSRQ